MAYMNHCGLCQGQNLKVRVAPPERKYFECSDCGLIALDPALRLSPNEERARYELHTNSTEEIGYKDFLKRMVEPLTKMLTPGMVGLDYGCGPGPTISYIMKESGFKVENFDPFFFPREFSVDDKFDFITCTEVIEHFFEPRIEFERIAKLIKLGGLIGIMTSVYDESIDFDTWWYRKDPTHVSIYQPETLDWIAKHFSWRITEPHKNVRIFQ